MRVRDGRGRGIPTESGSSSARRPGRRSQRSGCDLRIGTSGWHYQHWRGPFYPENLPARDMLAWYVERFDTVEINNSFYHLPSRDTFAAWYAATPAPFCFAVKGSRYITHRKKLKDPRPALERFLPPVEVLGRKLGPILFQLPPRWARNLDRLTGFLEGLPNTHRYTFEFRDPSWHDPAVYRLLTRYNAAFCIYELGGFASPLAVTADFAYIRLHGPGNKYEGDYSAEALDAWAGRIDGWRRTLAAVYVYFDNDQAGFAVKNAIELKTRL